MRNTSKLIKFSIPAGLIVTMFALYVGASHLPKAGRFDKQGIRDFPESRKTQKIVAQQKTSSLNPETRKKIGDDVIIRSAFFEIDEGTSTKMKQFRQHEFKDWVNREAQVFSSPQEAIKILPADMKSVFRYPDMDLLRQTSPKTAAAINNLIGIYVIGLKPTKTDAPSEVGREILMFFNDGLKKPAPDMVDDHETIYVTMTMVGPDDPGFDAGSYAAGIKKDIEKGENRADKFPATADINGATGYGIDPGYNVIGGDKYPRMGFVSWRNNGAHFKIYGTKDENGTSLKMLLEIARSMR